MTEVLWDELDELEVDAAGLHEPDAVTEPTPGGMTRLRKPRAERPVAVLASVIYGRTCFYFG